MPDIDGSDISLPQNLAEELAMIEGIIAEMALQAGQAAGQRRRGAFHALRCAARIDPVAAYNLGNHCAQSLATGRCRPRRRTTSLLLFECAVTVGLSRLLDATAAFEAAPRRERDLRDVVSRALTNIGADLSNAGHPARAVRYFQQAIRIFPLNANAHVCLGNMGVHHATQTGVDPLDGIASWAEAARLGDQCHESDTGCPCRATFVRVARQVERDYGTDAARTWIVGRYGTTTRKRGSDFAAVAARAGEAKRLTGTAWPAKAIRTADWLEPVLGELASLPLEMRVTFAGSLVASLCRLPPRGRAGDGPLLAQAVERAHGIEPLHPFLGDTDWRDMGPPDTFYLTAEAVRADLLEQVSRVVVQLPAAVPGLGAHDAVLGMLFHLDRGFRRGVADMAGQALARAPDDLRLGYVPAMVIGSPARH